MFYDKNNELFMYLMGKNVIIIWNNGLNYLLWQLLALLKTYGVIKELISCLISSPSDERH